jgi:protein gp37
MAKDGFPLTLGGLPKNLWFGVSVTKQEDVWRLDSLRNSLPDTVHKFVSFEPLHEEIDADLREIEWVIIGAESGNRNDKIVPESVWIKDIYDATFNRDIPIFIKDNAFQYCPHHWPLWDRRLFQQFPEAMQ